MKKLFKEFIMVDLSYIPNDKFYYFDDKKLKSLSELLSYIFNEYKNLRFVNSNDVFIENYIFDNEIENIICDIVIDNHEYEITKYDNKTNSRISVNNDLTDELFELRMAHVRTYICLYFIIKGLRKDDDLDIIYENIINQYLFKNTVIRNTLYDKIIKFVNNNRVHDKYKDFDINEFKEYFFNSKNFSKSVANMFIYSSVFNISYESISNSILYEYIEKSYKIDRIENFKSIDNKIKRYLDKAIRVVSNDMLLVEDGYDKFRHDINQAFYNLFPENKFKWCLNEVLTYNVFRPNYECEYILNKLMKNAKYTSNTPITVYHGITFNKFKHKSLDDYLKKHDGIKSLTDSIDIAYDFANRGDETCKPYILEIKINPKSKHVLLYKLLEDLYHDDPSTYYYFYKNFHHEKEILADLNDHEFRVIDSSVINNLFDCAS